MICIAAKGMASLTKRTNDIASPFLCMMATATSVEAEPIGVRLPPRLARRAAAGAYRQAAFQPTSWIRVERVCIGNNFICKYNLFASIA